MYRLRSAAVGGIVSQITPEGHGETHFVSRSVHQGYPVVMVVYHAMDDSELNEREQSKSSSGFSMTGELDCTHAPKDIFLLVRRRMRDFRVGDHGSSNSSCFGFSRGNAWL